MSQDEAFNTYIRGAIFDFLVRTARKHETTTYEAIALEFGLPSSGNQLGATLSPILGDIFRFCADRNMPPLTVLVVRKSGTSKGLPGEGFWTLFDVSRALDSSMAREELAEELKLEVQEFWTFH